MWLILIGGLFLVSIAVSVWFTTTQVGWLIEAVPDSARYRDQWQLEIDRLTEIQHPAVIHWLPESCLCRFFSIKHAGTITQQAEESGFNVYQLESSTGVLGAEISLTGSYQPEISPSILITRPNGQLSYVGAYSDSIRCNTGTSMVGRFIEDPDKLPDRTIVGLDVKNCRCTN